MAKAAAPMAHRPISTRTPRTEQARTWEPLPAAGESENSGFPTLATGSGTIIVWTSYVRCRCHVSSGLGKWRRRAWRFVFVLFVELG